MTFLEKVKSKKVIIGVIISVVVIGGSVVGFSAYKNMANHQASQNQGDMLDTYTIPSKEKVFINGIIKPIKSEDFSPNQEEISNLAVSNNQSVGKGDLLYTIKNQVIIDQIDGLKIELESAQKTKNSMQSTIDEETGEVIKPDTSEIDNQISNINSQITSLNKKAYESTYAPFSGKVYINDETSGESTGAYMTLESTEYYMSGTISEQDLVKIEKGNKTKVLLLANNKEVEGEITYISDRPTTEAVDNGYGGSSASHYDVNIKMKNQKSLINGLSTQASIELKNSDYKVPNTAIKKDEKDTYVFIDNNGVLEKRVIKIKEESKDFSVVEKGLNEGDVLIRYVTDTMKDGDTTNSNSQGIDNSSAQSSSIEESGMSSEVIN